MILLTLPSTYSLMPEAMSPVKLLLVGSPRLASLVERKEKADIFLVDGANWRTSAGMGSNGTPYPDNLLSGQEIANVTGKKKSKL